MAYPLRFLTLAFVLLAGSACSPSGAAPGAPCHSAFDCASRLCLLRSTGAVCVARCNTTSDCNPGDVCGAFNFGGVDPESGTFDDGGDFGEVVRVCRERLNPVCDPSTPCGSMIESCLGGDAPRSGVCASTCFEDGACASRLCIGAAAAMCGGGPGVCAPLCDDLSECPSGWYCNLVGAPAAGHGRCDPMNPTTTDASGPAVCGDASTSDF